MAPMIVRRVAPRARRRGSPDSPGEDSYPVLLHWTGERWQRIEFAADDPLPAEPLIPGAHNRENAAAATANCAKRSARRTSLRSM